MFLITLVDFLHLLVAVVWIGGMIFMKLVLMPAAAALDPAQRGMLLGGVAKRFTITAWTSTIVLLLTGLSKTPDGMLGDLSSDYGQILTAKHVLFGIMVIVGLIITLGVAPRLKRYAPGPGEAPSAEFVRAQKRLDALSGTNTVLGILILVAMALI